MSKKYQNFYKVDNNFLARLKRDEGVDKLDPGVYELNRDEKTGEIYFSGIKTNSDGLLKLPSPEFSTVINQIEQFLKPETRALFDKYKFIYKRSALLYGPPGTGKTCIVNQVADQVKNAGGIVLFNPNPVLLRYAIDQLNDIQPETTVLVVFEELEELIESHEESLLSLLDGEVQRSNVIYIATTNFINKIPPRIKRPGRFSSLVEVGYPNAEVRKYYLDIKLGNDKDINYWVKSTKGLTIDELKEVVLAVKCLGCDLEETIKKVQAVRSDTASYVEKEQDEFPVRTEYSLSGLMPLY